MAQLARPLHALCLVSTHSLHSPACVDLLSHVAWLDGMGLFASSLLFVPSSPEPSNVTHAREPQCWPQAPFPPWQAGALGDQGVMQSLCRKSMGMPFSSGGRNNHGPACGVSL